jgi:hypothetical protein
MTRYFFDVVDGSRHFGDTEGIVLLDHDRAIGEARRILGDVVRDGLGGTEPSAAEFSIVIRTSETISVGRIGVTLSIELTA